ncbi:hypothetical protein Q5M85_13700 [Paraclostridium bifermentans]|nr:hypothetical protein [Paraclostridium bifermentans]
MNNLVMQDLKLTDMNNDLVENSDILITEINNKINALNPSPAKNIL